MARGRVIFSADRCKACGLCVEFCPKNILVFDDHTINILGFHPVMLLQPDECTGCGICGLMCPDLVIQVERE